jgi:acyl carrier protein
MSQAQPVPPPAADPDQNPREKLGRLPAAALRGYDEFMKTGDEQALGALVVEVLKYCLAKNLDQKADVKWVDDARLVEDLGFDSLATIETVFFFEDLFHISVSNEEIAKVKTLGDLRQFVRGKLGAAKA